MPASGTYLKNNTMEELINIRISEFQFSKRHEKIFEDTGFTLNKGEIVGVTGVNGTGKSTLLNLILGFIKSGNVSCKLNAEFSYLGDSVGYHPNLNYITHKDFFKNLVGEHYEPFEFFDLKQEYREKQYRHLSLGNKSKARINLSLYQPYAVMDEPTEGLDADSRLLFMEKIKKHVTSGLLVSHDADFISEVCTHKVVLENHKISEKIKL